VSDDYESEWQYHPEVGKTGFQFRWMRALMASELPVTVKLTGLVEATWGDEDGTNVHPGTPKLAAAIGKDAKRVSDDRRRLAETGWHKLLGGHSREVGVTDHYRLTIPDGAVERPKLKPAVNRRPRVPLANWHTPRLKEANEQATEERQSGVWLNWWLKTVLRCPAFLDSERIVAAAVALSGNGIGTNVHSGVDNLTVLTNLSRETVMRALAALRESGAAERAMRSRQHGAGLRDAYVLGEIGKAWFKLRTAERKAAKARQSETRKAAARVRKERQEQRRAEVEAAEPGGTAVPTECQPCSNRVALLWGNHPLVPPNEDQAECTHSGPLSRTDENRSETSSAEHGSVAEVFDFETYRRNRSRAG
jgi:hypothetical protein